MRRLLCVGALAALFLWAALLAAEPIVRGHVLPAGKALAGRQEGPTVLVHVFNPDAHALPAASLRIGVQIAHGSGKPTSLEIPAGRDLPAAGMATWRLHIPAHLAPAPGTANAWFAAYARQGSSRFVGERRAWDNVDLEAVVPTGGKVEQLYTEAPALADPAAVVPPADIPFEHEVAGRPDPRLPVSAPHPAPAPVAKAPAGRIRVPAAGKALAVAAASAPAPAAKPATKPAARPTAKTVATKPATPAGTPAAVTPPVAPAAVTATPDRDPKVFKSIRTIDEELVIYVVRPGDTLAAIARRYYGDAGKEKAIADYNFIEKAGAVKVGEEIIVDVRPLAAAKTAAPTGKKPARAARSSKHTPAHTQG